MGWFNKEKKEEKGEAFSLPELPKLPKLEKLPRPKDNEFSKLPKFPSFPLEKKSFQNIAKNTFPGEKKWDKENLKTENFTPIEHLQKMQEPFQKALTRNLDEGETKHIVELTPVREEIPEEFVKAAKITKKAESIFIRLDKFEESLELFNTTKQKIAEIKEGLENIKILKEKEEKELDSWDREMQDIKNKIEKIDKEIFSRIE